MEMLAIFSIGVDTILTRQGYPEYSMEDRLATSCPTISFRRLCAPTKPTEVQGLDRKKQMWDRWTGLASAMAIQACGGLTYTFAVYSEHLKEVLHCTQEQTDDIGAAKDFGYCLGIVGGLLYNCYPPFVTISAGALFHFMGYITVWMTITERISPPLWLLCVAIAVGAGGDSWMDAACLFTNLQSFENRGTVMGVLKAQIGLSGAIFVTIYEAFLKPDVNKYVLLLATAPTATGLVLAAFIRPFPSGSVGGSQSNTKRRFQLTYGAIISLAVFLLITIIVQAVVDDDLGRPVLVAFAVIMISIMTFTFLTPVLYTALALLHRCPKNQRLPSQSVEFAYLATGKVEDNVLNTALQPLSAIGEHEDLDHYSLKGSSDAQLDSVGAVAIHPGENDCQPLKGDFQTNSEDVLEHSMAEKSIELCTSERPIELTLWQALQGLNFWFLALVVMTGPGCGLAVINNLSQMGKALDVEDVELYVGLFSVWSCLGRLIAGYGSDSLLRAGYPRTLCLGGAHVTMLVGCLLLAIGNVQILYLGSALVGLAYGGFWSLTPCIISEVFGLRNFAAIYKSIVSMGPIGAYLFSAKLVGFLYDQEVIYYHRKFPGRPWNVGDENTCYGQRCFGFSLLFLSVVCFIGAAVDVVLVMRTSKFYQR